MKFAVQDALDIPADIAAEGVREMIQVIKETKVWNEDSKMFELDSCDNEVSLAGYQLGRNYRNAAGAKNSINAMKKSGLRDDRDSFVIVETTFVFNGNKRTEAWIYERLV